MSVGAGGPGLGRGPIFVHFLEHFLPGNKYKHKTDKLRSNHYSIDPQNALIPFSNVCNKMFSIFCHQRCVMGG